jgi:hypothetical protein
MAATELEASFCMEMRTRVAVRWSEVLSVEAYAFPVVMKSVSMP